MTPRPFSTRASVVRSGGETVVSYVAVPVGPPGPPCCVRCGESSPERYVCCKERTAW